MTLNEHKLKHKYILFFGRTICIYVGSNPSEYNCFLRQWFHYTLPGSPSEIAGEKLIFMYFLTFEQFSKLNIAAGDCYEGKCGE